MKKNLQILLTILAIVVSILIGTARETQTDNHYLSSQEKIKSKPSKIKSDLIINDTIPQGKFTYEIYFAEFGGRMPNRTCDIEIIGNKITVSQNETTNLTGGKIIFKGLILKHKSGEWILAHQNEEINSDEIGGCTEIPIIDFDKKLIEWC